MCHPGPCRYNGSDIHRTVIDTLPPLRKPMENQRNVRENKKLEKEVAVKKAKIREIINDLQLIQSLEKSLEENNRQKSLSSGIWLV